MATPNTDWKVAEAYRNADAEAPPQYTERDNVRPSAECPPNYTQAIANDLPPPSYDSLYGRVKAARSESRGVFDFLKTFLIIILSTVGFTILIGILMAVPVSMIVMGALYKNDCPAEHMIPIYLIVAGSFGSAKTLFSLFQRCRMSEEEREEDQKRVNPLETIVSCFLLAWFITGCVYIYRIKAEVDFTDTSSEHYCNETLYLQLFIQKELGGIHKSMITDKLIMRKA
ncbi:hypothetical protein Btru_036549 [Bulinus truncatus]|nr:hypothetical protein Btru_036549 [Bulinus truncatus]